MKVSFQFSIQIPPQFQQQPAAKKNHHAEQQNHWGRLHGRKPQLWCGDLWSYYTTILGGLGSPAFISHVHGHLEGELPNLTGMILHVWYCNNMWCVLYFFGIPSILDIWWHMFGYLYALLVFYFSCWRVVPGCIWHTTKKTTVKQDSPIHLPSTIELFTIQLSIIISFAWCTLSTMKAPCQHPLQHKNQSKTSAWTWNHLTMFQVVTSNQQRYQLWPLRDSSTFAERWNPFP